MVSVPDRIRPLLPRQVGRSAATAAKKRRPAKTRRLEYKIIRAVMGLCVQAALVVFTGAYISSVMSGGVALKAYINDRAALFVSDADNVNSAIHSLVLTSTELDAGFGDGALPPVVEVPSFDFKVDYTFALANAKSGDDLSDRDDCYRALYEIVREDYTYAFTLYADNIKIASGAHYDDAAKAVERLESILTEAALDEGADIDEVRISNNIIIKYGLCEKTRILPADVLYLRLSALLAPDTANKSRISSSVSGGIDPACDYGINRVITNGGAPVSAVALSAVPALATENIKAESSASLIDYKTVYIESNDYYIGESFVQTKGVAGLESVTYDLVMDDGQETARRVATREIIAAPTDEVIVVGTRVLPQTVPTGTFNCPVAVPYEITSYFGEQRSEFDGDAYHYGVDFAGKKGAPVYASDGGTVIYAGYSRSYGLMIKIDHGSGLITCYAHCSKLLFSVGDAVYQGQQIALVGDTGIATGPHLHFEIRKNGAYVNPMKYLEK